MLEGKTILVVDDDDRNILALSAALKLFKPTILVARDGHECLERLNEFKTDLVLLDMMMPRMDGYETLKEIRKNPELKSVPVISLTAQAMVGDKQKCLNAGADDYCPKPVDIDILIGQIKQLLCIR